MMGTPTARAAAVLLAVGALTVTACSGPVPATPPAAAPTGAAAGAMPGPGSVVRSSLDHAAMDAVVEQTATELHQPGMVVLIRTPHDEYVNARGVTEWRGSTPVTPDTKMRIGSNTKTMTGTAILQMVQEGKIALTDPVARYLPDVPGGEAITIAQLGDMRSGLFNYTETLELNTALDTEPGRVWTNEELLALAFANPPYFAPGQGWHYSNTNTVLLGEIAEQIDRKPLDRILQDRFFTPMGLRGTSFPAGADSTMPASYSHGYMYGTNVAQLSDPSLPAGQLAEVEAGTLDPADHTDDNTSWAGAAGRGVSTTNDLAVWVKAMVGGQLLDAATQQARVDSMLPTGNGADYGFALAQLGPLYGHTGGLPGFNSFMGYDPVNDVTIVAWANLAPAANGFPPAEAVVAGLLPLVYATPPPVPDLPEAQLPG
ncbi:serine hydrolase domain-containing protein [Pseudonocardia charpentierae]|uniref:Serine hydrolase domain-containing protein n=1 Tax=Pseudonocardia charpentierae TaxID=3075545 RepID=A0ABU2NGF3_9PSEU|nr:serine hydrolase domain-containing protein [Pseudonocardia sp. DSM 45834]MDT0353047.1 serine hydrolase domain-containing protein [Pseudonocardia sp. DSM 45834]